LRLLPLTRQPLLIQLLLLLLLQSNASLYALWPNGSCAAMGLQGKVNTSLSTLLDAMINASNSADDALTLRELLEANAGELA
jgi:acetyl-CoA carboxylase carboxyltransferase component